MHIQWLKQNTCYDGTQLRPHWIYEQIDRVGDACVAWVGPAQVSLDHMVDVEDVKAAAPIASPKMLHFLGEFFHMPLFSAVVLQRLFILLLKEELHSRGVGALKREGDDLYWEAKQEKRQKLSVSIATLSPVSALLHVGVNVETHGTPVPTAGLSDWEIDPKSLAEKLLAQFQQEYSSLQRASWKVRPV